MREIAHSDVAIVIANGLIIAALVVASGGSVGVAALATAAAAVGGTLGLGVVSYLRERWWIEWSDTDA